MDSSRCRASTRSAHNRTQRYFVSSTLTNGSIRSPRTVHRPDVWDRPGKRRVPSRCAHTVLETTDETGRGHVEQPGLHAAGRASRCWGAMSGRLRINPGPPHQQNTSPLHGVAMTPARAGPGNSCQGSSNTVTMLQFRLRSSWLEWLPLPGPRPAVTSSPPAAPIRRRRHPALVSVRIPRSKASVGKFKNSCVQIFSRQDICLLDDGLLADPLRSHAARWSVGWPSRNGGRDR